MKHPVATVAHPPKIRRRWHLYRSLVFGVFRPVRADAMRVHLPEGGFVDLGQPCADEPPAEIRVHSERFFRRLVLAGEIGFGEAYMDGDWDTADIPRVIRFFIRNRDDHPGLSARRSNPWWYNVAEFLNRGAHRLRRNTRRNSRRNIADHYDLSNDFYALWLDSTWTYSSAYFESPDFPLEKAQEAKYDRLARRLDLRPGQHVLEIGCGWGGNAIYLATHFGVQVTGITISREQLELAQARVREAGLEDRIELKYCDYRDVEGEFDAIISIEMLEAVGHDFLETYFAQCHRLLKASGQLGLQVILSSDARYEAGRKSADWIKKHIFPGGQLPCMGALNEAVGKTSDLYLEHLESFGDHYARTLRLWRERFNERLDHVCQLGFDERFIRKWNYYLSYCEGAFSTEYIDVAQLVYARPGREARPPTLTQGR